MVIDLADPPGRSGPSAGVLAGGLVALALVVLAVVLLNGGGGGDNGSQTAKKTATPAAKKETKKKTATPTATATATATATPTATPTASATATPTQSSGNEPASNDPTQLQLQAYNLNRAGKSADALPVAQKAVRLGCKGSGPVSPCGYALFELAKAQRGTGDAKGAVKTLNERLKRYPDDQRAAVEAELDKAKADAGE
ncbi:MAG: hypothetical protein ABI611_18705 [Solirubrobacteraceae bacterium]